MKIEDSGSMDSFRARCREMGLKVTPQRQVIFEELLRSNEHPTAEQLHASVTKRMPNVSLDTVNRTLLTFAEIGLADIVEGNGRPRRYDPDMSSHHHVHCVRCGAIVDFPSSEFDGLKVPPDIRRRFKVLNKRVVISAICPGCRR